MAASHAQDALGVAASGEGELLMGLQGFHPLNAGIDFRDAYLWGLHGTFLNFTQARVSVIPQLVFIYQWRACHARAA